jgi:putative ABC transport system permease protein
MNVLLRLSLLLCPREFRCEHRDRIAADAQGVTATSHRLFAMCADIAIAGLAMRAENIGRDLRYSVRSLAKAPLFAVVAGGAIALAIGANIAVSSVLFGVALKPLPFPDPNRLVFVSAGTSIFGRLSFYDGASIRAGNHSFTALALARESSLTYIGDGTTPIALTGHLIDGTYFGVLGARAQIGRLLNDSDLSHKHMVLSFQTWQRVFSGDPNILGKRLRFGSDTYSVVGVAAPGFQDPAPYGLSQSAFWVPIDMHSPMAFSRVWRACYGIARLAPNVSATQAFADASRIVAGLARKDPSSFVGITQALVLPFFHVIVGPAVPLLWMLYAVVGVVLIIACANVANLNLVRAAKRDRELRIRSAVGATRARIMGQLVTEAALLAGTGGLVGLGIAAALLTLFRGLAAELLPRFENAVIDPTIVLYTVGLMIFCTIFIGVIPAFATRGTAPTARSSESRGANRVRSVLIVTEIALALAVVVNAGLIVRSYVALTHVPVGFDGRNTYVVDYVLVPVPSPPKLATFIQASTKALHAIPGVVAVSPAGPVPFVYDYFVQTFSLPGHSERFTTNKHIIGNEYFTVFGVPLLRGRLFNDRDAATSASVAIVNARFAQRYFGTPDVVGRRLAFQSFTGEPSVASTIVGVTGDVRNAFYSPPEPEAFVPVAQALSAWRYVIRTSGADAGLAGSVTRALRGVEPTLPTPVVTPYSELFFRNSNQSRAATVLFGALGLVALLLALAGVFAVTSYSAEQRTREFGIRKAIGARRGDILQRVLRSALLQSCIGIGIGLLAATVSTRLLTSLLFETSPFDPITLTTTVVLLIFSTMIAAGAPALRATAVDPATALRYE